MIINLCSTVIKSLMETVEQLKKKGIDKTFTISLFANKKDDFVRVQIKADKEKFAVLYDMPATVAETGSVIFSSLSITDIKVFNFELCDVEKRGLFIFFVFYNSEGTATYRVHSIQGVENNKGEPPEIVDDVLDVSDDMQGHIKSVGSKYVCFYQGYIWSNTEKFISRYPLNTYFDQPMCVSVKYLLSLPPGRYDLTIGENISFLSSKSFDFSQVTYIFECFSFHLLDFGLVENFFDALYVPCDPVNILDFVTEPSSIFGVSAETNLIKVCSNSAEYIFLKPPC